MSHVKRHCCYSIRAGLGVMFLLLFVSFEAFAGSIIFCDQKVTSGNDGTSWDNAFNDLQIAIDAAEPGDEVWVKRGVFKDGAYIVRPGVKVFGGFDDSLSGTEGDKEGRSLTDSKSVIDGEFSRNALILQDGSSFDGFVIENAVGLNGGVVVADNGSSVLKNCAIRNNRAQGENAIISAHASNLMVEGCWVFGNIVEAGGGALASSMSQVVMKNCIISANFAEAGGAIYNKDGELTIVNCTIAHNIAQNKGPAIYNESAMLTVINSVVWYNQSKHNGRGHQKKQIFSKGDIHPVVTYSNIMGGYWGEGNINVEPSFNVGSSKPYTLSRFSPCIDAADGDAAPTNDISGWRRSDAPHVSNTGTGEPSFADMGAYEFRTPGKVSALYVANLQSIDELAVKQHFDELDYWQVETLSDDQINSETDLSPFDIVILSGFSPAISEEGLARIESTGLPILILEGETFDYAARLGIVNSAASYRQLEERVKFEAVYTDFTQLLGFSVQMYQSPAPVDSVTAGSLAAETYPIGAMSSDGTVLAYPVLASYTSGIIASGISRASQFSASGWLFFDMLLHELAAPAPVYGISMEMWDVLPNTGVLNLVDQILENPEGYSEDSVKAIIGRALLQNRLMTFAHGVLHLMDDSFPNIGQVPTVADGPEFVSKLPHPPRCGFSDQKWVLGQYRGDHATEEHVYPFLADGMACSEKVVPDKTTINWGKMPLYPATIPWYKKTSQSQDPFYPWNAPAANLNPAVQSEIYYSGLFQNDFSNTNYVNGVDMGVNINLRGRRFFYFGDTWAWIPGVLGVRQEWCSDVGENPETTCDPGAMRNDAIAMSGDSDMTDGLDLRIINRYAMQAGVQFPMFNGIFLPGVYNQTDKWGPNFWKKGPPQFTVNTDAVTVKKRVYYPEDNFGKQMKSVELDTVVLFHTTANNPIAPVDGLSWEQYCAVIESRQYGYGIEQYTPRLWAGWSMDGIHFLPLYQAKDSGDSYPFDVDEFQWDSVCGENAPFRYSEERRGRFLRVTSVFIKPEDFRDMCARNDGYDKESPFCSLPLWAKADGGILIFGSGRPGNLTSPISVAYLPLYLLGETRLLDPEERQSEWRKAEPRLFYYTGLDESPWSLKRHEAAYLPKQIWQGNHPCAADAYGPPEQCPLSDLITLEQKQTGLFGDPSTANIVYPEGEGGVPYVLLLYQNMHFDECGPDWTDECRNEKWEMGPNGWKYPPNWRYRVVRLSRPWDLMEYPIGSLGDVYGYGTYPIVGLNSEAHTFERSQDPEEGLSFHHLLTTPWNQLHFERPEKAATLGMYGVFSRKATIPWPPTPEPVSASK